MSEQELRKRFKKGITICAVMGILILCMSISVLTILNKSLNEIVSEQMKNEAKEYKRRIFRQINKDFESLEGLAVFMNGYTLEDIDSFSQRLYDAKKTNSFVHMAYFGLDGKGVIVNTNQDTKTDVDYHSLGQGVQDVVESAYQGIAEVSPLFDSTISNHQVFAYSVPVYNDEKTEIIGVLSASNPVEIFEELLDGDKILNGNDAVHLISSTGDLLFSSTDPENSLHLQSLLYSPYFFDKNTQAKMRAALPKGDSLFCSMTYENRAFRVYLYPVGINNWYIMCVNNPTGVNYIAHRMVRALGITFTSLFVVVAALLVYVMKMNSDNTKSLLQIAYKDHLTNADNIFLFMKNLNKEIALEQEFSIAAINIYQFKFINEIMGVKAANEILIHICECISRTLRDDEFFCRENADLFYIFFRDTDKQMLQWKLERLMQDISDKSISKQKDYLIRTYAGALICSKEELKDLSTELIIVKTRFAMQHAKRLHSAKIHFYDEDIHKKEELENYVETHMHQALENGEFRLFLQPKINLKTGKLSGAEALVRWITEEGQMIYPDVFIPQFEENGFCTQLDMYMFEQACRQIRTWMDSGVEPIPISVNQSKLLFFDAGYIPFLRATINKYKIPASMFTLEILESLVLGHAEELNEKLHDLRNIGFKISMDDFGSGYSSFNTLGSLEIDELKLDREFLLEVSRAKDNRFKLIMAHIVHLTKSLNISTVAEGVETEENESLIQSLGCDYGQGYFYSRPVSSKEFSEKYMQTR